MFRFLLSVVWSPNLSQESYTKGSVSAHSLLFSFSSVLSGFPCKKDNFNLKFISFGWKREFPDQKSLMFGNNISPSQFLPRLFLICFWAPWRIAILFLLLFCCQTFASHILLPFGLDIEPVSLPWQKKPKISKVFFHVSVVGTGGGSRWFTFLSSHTQELDQQEVCKFFVDNCIDYVALSTQVEFLFLSK